MLLISLANRRTLLTNPQSYLYHRINPKLLSPVSLVVFLAWFAGCSETTYKAFTFTMVHKAPETNGSRSDDMDTVQRVAAVESKTQMIQRNDNDFVLEFAGRLSLRSSDCKRSTAFQQDWRTVADPSFGHLTFGTNNTAQQVNNSTGDDPDATHNLACPFLKHNPGKYKDWKCCNTWNGWPTVHRVKEHLYRKHLLPKNICLRCGEHYQSEDKLAVHLRTNPPCEIRTIQRYDGIDAAMEKRLKSRVRDGDLSEEVKWIKLYKLLFPEDNPTPSPFHERSMAEHNAKFITELSEHLCRDFSRLSRLNIMEMFANNCSENNGVLDPEKIVLWAQDIALASINSFKTTESTSGDQKSTTPGLPSQASLHLTGTASADIGLGHSSQASFWYRQQITGTPFNSNVDPQLLSSFWDESAEFGVDPTQLDIGGFSSALPPSGIE